MAYARDCLQFRGGNGTLPDWMRAPWTIPIMKGILQIGGADETDRAVSPVIGVILMVAITVILAAVIGTFVLGLGQDVTNAAPTTQISMSDASDSLGESNDSLILVSHNGGDELKASELKIVVKGGGTEEVIDPATGSSTDLTTDIGSTVSVGGSFTINENSNYVNSQTSLTVEIIHKPSQSIIASNEVNVN